MLDGLRKHLARQLGPRSAAPPSSRATARYMRPDSGGIVQAWQPSLRSTADDVRQAWTGVAARTIDAAQNQGWIAGAVDQQVVDQNGPFGLTLNATPDPEELGWSQDEADAWARKVERRFRAWANNPLECDVRAKMTLAAMADAVSRWFFPFGEACGRILIREKPGATTRTKIQLLSPHRLSQDCSELQNLHQGVFLDSDGAPIGYRFKAKPNTYPQYVDLPARDADGRPLVIHVMDGAPDQTRGISVLAPALRVTRQFDQLADATLTTTLLQTIFAATMESAALPGEAMEGLLTDQDLGGGGQDLTAPGGIAALVEARLNWYQGAGIDLGTHGRVNHAFPGDKLTLHRSEHPNGNYLPFSQNMLREIARCIGTTYEAFTGDYQGATFSSLKMGIASNWPLVVRRRNRVPAPFMQLAYEAWLEEQVAEAWIAFPGGYPAFLRQRSAACKAQWRGPAKPSPDELKSAKAAQAYKDMGVLSIASASADLGIDWEQEQEQRAQERKRIMELGLPDPYAPQPGAPAAADLPDPTEDPAGGQPA